MRLVFYISGHGYGHAVRDIEIAKSVLKKQPSAEIHFRTQAPKWLFEPLLSDRVFYHPCELDFGVVQKNSFSADKKATFERYAGFISQKEKLIDEEVAFLKTVQPDKILADITPFAFDAAETYGKKAIAIGNFSWDWIYAPYLADHPEFAWIVQDIKDTYGKAERLWCIPFYGDMSAFPNIENVPLVGRRSTASKKITREKIGIPGDSAQKYVLLGLRMADLQGVNWAKIEKMPNVVFVAVGRDVRLANCIHLKDEHAPFEDVLHACDAVLSKPGYSIVSEVICNQTPIVYVPRRDFVEDPELIAGLRQFAVCEDLSQADFYAGEWQPAFDRLFARPNIWKKVRCDGAEVIAGKVVAG